MTQLTKRNYQGEKDFWRIRQFLRTTLVLNGYRLSNWHVVRFDYWYWHIHKNIDPFDLGKSLFIWENSEGEIVAVLQPEEQGEIFLHVHPEYRFPALEEEMLSTAEEILAVPNTPDMWRLQIWCDAQDTLRQNILSRRGFIKGDQPEYQRRRSMDLAIPNAKLAPGYTIRAMGDIEEHPQRSLVSWRAFHPDETDDAYQGWKWYINVQNAPLYRRDLDIVVEAPSGEFAAFCTVWFDDMTRTGVFEPVGTAPAYQRQGLGKAILCEGLRRVKQIGATLAYVGSYSERAGALYASVGFTEYDLCEPWVKEVPPGIHQAFSGRSS